jgi:glycosyltransferase involved in cell wall biosynthesis
MTEKGPATVVIPCFNEAGRLDAERLASLAASGRVRLLFVDDGSTDETQSMLRPLSEGATAVEVLALPENVGKAEAVRRGLLHAVASGADVAGYYDADLATPPRELLRLLEVLDSGPDLLFVMGSRVRLLGRTIDRSARRHYLGRVFATLSSLILDLPVYDTQCGAKVFRVTPGLEDAVSRPFRSSWAFDVELIGRLLRGSRTAQPYPPEAFEEVPLEEWHDVSGSKIGLREMARALLGLAAIGAELHRRGAPR